MSDDPRDYIIDRLDGDDPFEYSNPGYKCVWTRGALDDSFCRIDYATFTDKTTGRRFNVSEIGHVAIRWVDSRGGLFKPRTAGYQIIGEFHGKYVVLLDASDKMEKKHDTASAQAVCRGEKNILKVALASLILAKARDDIRRTYFEVFDRYGSDIYDRFPWPEHSFV